MQEVSQISEFGKIFIFLILGVLFILLGYLVNSIISPKNPNPEKLTTYECGEEPVGNSWIQFNMRFYIIALVFLLFEIEIVFLFPWATVFADPSIIAQAPLWGWFSLVEMFIFIGILLIGLVYIWRKGDLQWIRSKNVLPKLSVSVPSYLYENINKETYIVKPFTIETKMPEAVPATEATTAPVKRPPFKSAIKKSE